MYAVPRYENFIAPEINMNVTVLNYKGYSTEERKQKVKTPPELGQIPDTPFDTLWSAVFVLDPKVNKQKEMWIV